MSMLVNRFDTTPKYLKDKKIILAQTCSLKKGERKFGDRAKHAAHEEMDQLDKRTVFDPNKVEDLTPEEKKISMESLMFLAEKRDGRLKSRSCANGSIQRKYFPK